MPNCLYRCAATFLLCALMSCAASPPASVSTVYIVRHAEKQSGDDPLLTREGEARAAALAEWLAGENIRHIYSTDIRRTRATAAPLADRLGIRVTIYAPDQGRELAARLKDSQESVLIVGHSNTIAELAAAFGVAPGEPVADDEYDRVYVIRLHPGAARGESSATETR